MKKVIGFLGIAIAMFGVVVPTAFAAEFIAGDEDSGNVTLSAGETHRNVYTAGGTIFVNSDINGDIYAVGGTITFESNVEQDAVIAGGTVTINGEVGGDIRVAGGTVTINNRVAGDVLVIGGTVMMTEKALISGDLVAAGGNLVIDSQVSGNAKIAGGTVTINGPLIGKVEIDADQSLVFGSKAVVPQTVTYRGPKEAVVQDGAQVSTIDFQMREQDRGNKAAKAVGAIFTVAFVVKALALILAGLLLLKLFPRTSQATVNYMQQGMWMNLLIGFIALIVGPIAFFLLLVTLLGMYIGFLVILVWLIMLLLAALVAAVFVGAWIIKMLTNKNAAMVYDWQALVIGIVVLALLILVPVIGSLIFFILLLIAFGGILRQLYDRMKTEQMTEQPSTTNTN